MKSVKKLISTLAIASLITACGSTSESDTPLNAGFLTDYSQLKLVDKGDESITKMFKSASFNKNNYDSMIIENIDFYPSFPKNAQISSEVANEVKQYISDNVQSSFQNAYQLTDKPGPKTLRLRSAITGLTVDDKEMSAYQYIPIAFLVTAASGGLSDMSVKLQVEMEIVDSTNGNVLSSLSKMDAGEDLDNNTVQVQFSDLQPLLERWFTSLNTAINK